MVRTKLTRTRRQIFSGYFLRTQNAKIAPAAAETSIIPNVQPIAAMLKVAAPIAALLLGAADDEAGAELAGALEDGGRVVTPKPLLDEGGVVGVVRLALLEPDLVIKNT
jgi:hypothetical protein